MEKKYLCIHGHFYQPPRENPWLEEVELEQSAYPYHDWNERITAECYHPNAFARILSERKIVDIIDNYSKISFNFGPTLLSWMERNDPATYRAILDSDRQSQQNFSGHGSALAQCFNHMIMPLANRRDKETQVIWGIRDFEERFHRRPEGMWLPETAVDEETLDIMAEHGIKFTILAPHQAKAVRKAGKGKWRDVTGAKIDPRHPYLCPLPTGRSIAVFFYDGPVSRDIAFSDVLNDGAYFARRLLACFTDPSAAVEKTAAQADHPDPAVCEPGSPELVNVATDGETYGHHHKFGDMALAYCLNSIEKNAGTRMSIYAEFLEKFPPTDEVRICEHTSWSCAHGVDRWQANCGCRISSHPSTQAWRGPLRKGLNHLRDAMARIYETTSSHWLHDPWQARNQYVELILNRSEENVDRFLAQTTTRPLTDEEKVKVLRLLEMQRHAMLMFTSCGWFFDDVSGLEATQILKYAARAIQLAEHFTDEPLEADFLEILHGAPSNNPEFKNAAQVYEKWIRPGVLNLNRVGAHYAVSLLFEDFPREAKIFCFTANQRNFERIRSSDMTMIIGSAHIRNDITFKEDDFSFAAVHLGRHEVLTGVNKLIDGKRFVEMRRDLKSLFAKQDTEGCIYLIKDYFEGECYSLHHLFKDAQGKVLFQLMNKNMEGIDKALLTIKDTHAGILQVFRQMQIPVPKFVESLLAVVMNTNLMDALSGEQPAFARLEQLVAEAATSPLDIDRVTLAFLVRKKVDEWMNAFEADPHNSVWLKLTEGLLRTTRPLALELNLWRAQNIYFQTAKRVYWSMRTQTGAPVQEWVKYFEWLGDYLNVRIPPASANVPEKTVVGS